jgi:hypothetical protein
VNEGVDFKEENSREKKTGGFIYTEERGEVWKSGFEGGGGFL